MKKYAVICGKTKTSYFVVFFLLVCFFFLPGAVSADE